MTIFQWVLLFLAVQLIHFGGTWRLYQKAGKKRGKHVPIYNAVILMDIIRRPRWWVILLFIPIINLMLFPVIWVETLRSFGKNSAIDTALGLLSFGLYTYRINYDKNATYINDRSLVREPGLVSGSMHCFLQLLRQPWYTTTLFNPTLSPQAH